MVSKVSSPESIQEKRIKPFAKVIPKLAIATLVLQPALDTQETNPEKTMKKGGLLLCDSKKKLDTIPTPPSPRKKMVRKKSPGKKNLIKKT